MRARDNKNRTPKILIEAATSTSSEPTCSCSSAIVWTQLVVALVSGMSASLIGASRHLSARLLRPPTPVPHLSSLPAALQCQGCGSDGPSAAPIATTIRLQTKAAEAGSIDFDLCDWMTRERDAVVERILAERRSGRGGRSLRTTSAAERSSMEEKREGSDRGRSSSPAATALSCECAMTKREKDRESERASARAQSASREGVQQERRPEQRNQRATEISGLHSLLCVDRSQHAQMSRSAAAAAASGAASGSRPALPPPRLSVPSSTAAACARDSTVPHFVIDLDAPPGRRWSALVSCYKHAWAPMVEGMWAEYEVAARDTAQEEMQHEEAEAKEAAAAEGKGKAKPHKKAGSAAASAAKKEAAVARASLLKSRTAAYLQQQMAFAENLATAILAGFRAEGLALYAEEIEALSELSGVSIRDLLLLNLSYEAHGGCTSVLLPLESGEMMLGRTLDWNQESALRALTVELSFMRGGALLYRAATFAGFLGIFTAHVPHRFAISVNFRCVDDEEGEEHGEEQQEEDEEQNDDEEGQEEDNEETAANDADADGDDSMESIFAAAGVKTSTASAQDARASASGGLPDSPSDAPFAYPVGYLVRHTLETCVDYTAATAKLSCAPLMSPAYFIVAGTTAQQGCIITRDLHASVQPMQIDPSASRALKVSAASESKGYPKKKQRGADAATYAASSSSSSAAAAASGLPAAPATAAAAAASTPLGSLFNMARSFISGSADAEDSADAASSALAAASPLATAFPSAAELRLLPAAAPSLHPWLIQANMDHWLTSKKLDHQQSLPRVALANHALLSLPSAASVDEESMWRVLAQNPIWDDETIYASVSIPARDRFVTLIDNPHPPPPRKKGAATKRKGGRKY